MKRTYILFCTLLFIFLTVRAAAPTTQATNVNVTSQGVLQLGINWTSGNGANRIVVAKAGAGPVDNPVNGTDYTPGAFGTGGAQIGATGSYVVAETIGAGSTATITGLNPASIYTIKVFEFNGTGASTEYNVTNGSGNPLTTTTLALEPTAQPTLMTFSSVTTSAMDVNFSAATGSPDGYIAVYKSASSPTGGTPQDGTTYSISDPIGDGAVAFIGSATTFNIASLSAGTIYHYDIYAYNGTGSNINYFTTSPLESSRTTLSNPPSNQPTAMVFSSVTTTSMDVNFTAAAGGAAGYIAVRKAGSSPSGGSPTDGQTYSIGDPIGDGTVAFIGNTLPFNNTSLSAGTTYHFDIYSYNGSGLSINYLTGSSPLESSQSTVASEPTAQPTSMVFSSFSTTGFNVGFTAASGSPTGYLAIRRTSSSPTGAPADGVTYAINDPIGDGSVVFVGASTSFSQSSLSAETEYYYDIFSYNGSGTAINYRLTSPLEGNRFTLSLEPNNRASSFSAANVAGTTNIQLTFSAASGLSNADGYVILRNQSVDPTLIGVVDGTAPGLLSLPGGTSLVTTINNTATTSYTDTDVSLLPNTNYHYTIISYNANAGQVGQTFNYYTSNSRSANATTDCVAPTVQASVLAAPSKATSTINLTWTRGNGGKVMVIARESSSNNLPSISTLQGTSYTANAAFGSGSTIAVSGNDYSVVFIGSGAGATSVTVTGLDASTAYSFAVYEFNDNGGGASPACYMGSPAVLANIVTDPPSPTSTITAGTGVAIIPATTNSSPGVNSFQFTITDAGDDGVDTDITQMIFTAGTGNDIGDWTQVIQGVELVDNAGNGNEDYGTPTIQTSPNRITFPSIVNNGDDKLGDINNGASKIFTLRVWLKSNVGGLKTTIDNQNLVFQINAADISTNNSGIQPGETQNSGSTNNSISVVASAINTTQTPSTSATATVPLATQPIYEAVDVNGNRDLDFNNAITVNTNNPNNLAPASSPSNFSSGVADFTGSGFNFVNTGMSTMSVTSNAITSSNSSTITVSAATTLAGGTTGTAPGPTINNGTTNQAVLGFSLQTTGSVLNFTGATINTTSDPDVVFNNIRIYSSATADFASATNIGAPAPTTPGNSISFSGFSASVSGTIKYFFIVVDVNPSFSVSNPTIQLSLTTVNTSVSIGSVVGSTQTGTLYSFLDATPPTILSITNNVNPIFEGALTQTVVVQFSEPMNATGAFNPTITLTGSNWGAQAAGNWSTTTLTNDTYTTTFLHNATQETIAAATATISTNTPRDLAGNATTNAPQSSAPFVVDNQKPSGTVTTSPAVITTNNLSALQVQVTYNEPMNPGVNPAINLTGGSFNAAPAGVWSVGNTVYTVSITHDGTPQTIASVTATTSGAQDARGNVQVITPASNSFAIDTQRPTVLSVNRFNPSSALPINNTSVVYRVIFSEAVSGVNSADFTQILSGITSGSIIVSTVNASTYDVTIGSISGDGTLRLDVLNTATINDTNGNAYNVNFTTGQVYTIDNTPPLLSVLSPTNNQFNIQLDANLSITLNENIKFGSGLIQLFNGGGLVESYTVGVSPELSISTNTLTINPTLLGGAGLFDQGTNYYIIIDPTAINDIAGNQFAGFTNTTDWTFTTFAPPIITSVAPLSGGASVCIGSDVVITGNFLTGVTEVRFNGAGGVLGTNLNLISDTELRARAPLNALPGPIYVRKAPAGSNPDVNTTSSGSVTTGPSSAVLSVGTINNPTVCTSGTLISSTIKIDVVGGSGIYNATYRIAPGAMPTQDNLVSSYTSGADITVNPIGTGVSNVFTIFSVSDDAGCVAPNISGSYAVFENQRPTVDAGGPATPPFNYCLANGNSIDLDAPTLGTAPSMTGASGVTWTRNGSGTFSNATALQPTYTISAFDILNNNLQLTITTTGNPTACDAAVDVLPINFVSNSTANPGGSGGVYNFCWNGTPTPPVQLNGSIAGGATGYQWNSISGLNTQFSSTTIQNPIYTFNATEQANGYADIELTPTGGTCGGPGTASPLKINLNPIPTNSFISPKTNVCTGETVTYKLTSTPGNTYNWTVPSAGGTTFENNGNSINVTWGITTGPYTISVVETRGSDGCQSAPIDLPVNLNEEPVPAFTSPSARIFGNQAAPVQLAGSGDVNNGTTSFSGPGVFINGSNQWFFSPSNAGVGNNYPIRYTYTSTSTGCSNFKDELFTVFDGDQSIVLYPSGSNLPDFCADEDAVEIKLNPAIASLMPADQSIFVGYTVTYPPPFGFPVFTPIFRTYTYQFTGFTGPGITANTMGADPRNIDGRATFNPKAVTGGASSTTIELKYFYQESIDGTPNGAPKEFGRQNVTINPVPTLFPNFGVVSNTLCSNNPSINLTKNETNNPGTNFTFFVAPSVSAQYPGIITGDAITGHVLNPSAYNAASFDAASIDIFYGFEDVKGCNDTTSVAAANTLRISLTTQPPQPIIDIGNNICITDGSVPVATITNVVSNSVANANTRWFNNINLNPPTLSQNPDFSAPINPGINNTFDFFAVQEINGCVSPITQLDYEVLNVPQFSWDKFCVDGTATQFDLNLGSVSATDLTWTILKSDATTETTNTITGAISGSQSFPYVFTSSDRYAVTADVTSINGCVASRTQPVILLDKFIATDAQIYNQDFEGGSGGFISLKDDASISNATWEYGVVNKNVIKNPINNPSNKAWVTNLSGAYNNGERSYLYSGCLDITGLQRPMISFSSWTNTDDKNDGVILQYSIDNKVINDASKEWNAVGEIGTGLDWFNRQLIQSIPGNKPTQNFGWSGDFDTGWKSSKHSLDNVSIALQNAGSNNVVFRFAFAATNAQTGKSLDGFAIDSLFIGNRTRTILLENFTNKGNIGNAGLEINQSNALKAFNPGGVGTRLVKINYHVGFPGEDPFNKDNGADPSARALYYNVTNTPSARLDGEKPAGPEQPFSQWGTQEYSLRTLQLGQSDIAINSSNNADGSISVTVDVVANTNLPDGTRLHIAILEELINLSDLTQPRQDMVATSEASFEYVLKKMLPTAPGLNTGPLSQGVPYSFGPFTWYPEPTKLYGQPDDLAIVAFLQDERSKEIYQAEIITGISDPPLVTGLDEIIDSQRVEIFPNPADEEITIQLPNIAPSRIALQMVDQVGRPVYVHYFDQGEQTKTINTRGLAGGVYLIQLGSGKISTRKKVMVVHNK